MNSAYTRDASFGSLGSGGSSLGLESSTPSPKRPSARAIFSRATRFRCRAHQTRQPPGHTRCSVVLFAGPFGVGLSGVGGRKSSSRCMWFSCIAIRAGPLRQTENRRRSRRHEQARLWEGPRHYLRWRWALSGTNLAGKPSSIMRFSRGQSLLEMASAAARDTSASGPL